MYISTLSSEVYPYFTFYFSFSVEAKQLFSFLLAACVIAKW